MCSRAQDVADVHGDAGLSRARRAASAVHAHRDERGEVRPGDPGRLGDAAVLLGHREQLEARSRAALSPARARLVAGVAGQEAPVDLRRAGANSCCSMRSAARRRPTWRSPEGSASSSATAPGTSPRATSSSASARRTPATSGAASRAARYSRTAVSASPRSRAAWASAHPALGGLQLERREPPPDEGVVRGDGLRPPVEGDRGVHVAPARGRRARADQGRDVVRPGREDGREGRGRLLEPPGPEPRVGEAGLRGGEARPALQQLLVAPRRPPRCRPRGRRATRRAAPLASSGDTSPGADGGNA